MVINMWVHLQQQVIYPMNLLYQVFFIVTVLQLVTLSGVLGNSHVTLLVSHSPVYQFTDPVVLQLSNNTIDSFCTIFRHEECENIIEYIKQESLFDTPLIGNNTANEVFICAYTGHDVVSWEPVLRPVLRQSPVLRVHDVVVPIGVNVVNCDWQQPNAIELYGTLLRELFQRYTLLAVQHLRSAHAHCHVHADGLNPEQHGEPRHLLLFKYAGRLFDLRHDRVVPYKHSYILIAQRFCDAHQSISIVPRTKKEEQEDGRALSSQSGECIHTIREQLAEAFDGPALNENSYQVRLRNAGLFSQAAGSTPRVAVITAIIGGYEASCKSFPAQTVDADFICFTDNATATMVGGAWDVDTTPYHFDYPSAFDCQFLHSLSDDTSAFTHSNISSNGTIDDCPSLVNSLHHNTHSYNVAKYYKQAFYNIPRLKQYDVVVWVDGSLQLTDPRAVEKLLLVLAEGSYSALLFNHSTRGSLAEEVAVTANMARYCATRYLQQQQPYQDIEAQYREYMRLTEGAVDKAGVWYASLVAFNMKHPDTLRLLDAWYLENLRATTNDQISFPYVLLANRINSVGTLPNDVIRGQYPNQQSSIHVKLEHGK